MHHIAEYFITTEVAGTIITAISAWLFFVTMWA
jgi:hypothetical protein